MECLLSLDRSRRAHGGAPARFVTDVAARCNERRSARRPSRRAQSTGGPDDAAADLCDRPGRRGRDPSFGSHHHARGRARAQTVLLARRAGRPCCARRSSAPPHWCRASRSWSWSRRATAQWWRGELADLPRENVLVQPANRGTAAGILVGALAIARRAPARPRAGAARPITTSATRATLARRLPRARSRRVERERPSGSLCSASLPTRPTRQYGWIVPAGRARAPACGRSSCSSRSRRSSARAS